MLFLIPFLCSIVAAQVGPRSTVLHGKMCGVKPRAHECCTCTETFGRCMDNDEDPSSGCSGLHESCADICPGDYPWKKLYAESKIAEQKVWSACDGFPTKHWPKAKRGGRFAVAFSGGVRQFVAAYHSWITNVVDSSGGMVDFYFHVWEDEDTRGNAVSREGTRLAKECPHTKGFVGEKFRQHLQLLNEEQPTLRGVVNDTRTSWIGDFDAEFNQGEARPYYVGSGYSQWRKVNLAHEMVRKSGIDYSLILRARPDHTVLEPLDLREFERHFSNRTSVKKANGHFISIPERSKQVITDHWAIGTPEAMYEYATQALPYTTSCCEGYVWRGLEMRCFARSAAEVEDDSKDEQVFQQLAGKAESENRELWPIAPPSLRPNKYSPLLLVHGSVHHLGQQVCHEKEVKTPDRVAQEPGCIPIYRPRFAYVFKASVSAWFTAALLTAKTTDVLPEEDFKSIFQKRLPVHAPSDPKAEDAVGFDGGVLCIQYTNEGEETGDFLLRAGIATRRVSDFETRYRNKPCVVVPTLKKAALAAAAYVKTLPSEDQKGLLQHWRRRLTAKSLRGCAENEVEGDTEFEFEEDGEELLELVASDC